MSPAHVRTRTTTKGEKRYDVRFRMGGRGYAVHHAGTFPTMKEARARRDFVAGEIAAGRDPRVALRELGREPVAPLTFRELGKRWLASRVDVRESTRAGYAERLKRVNDAFGDRDPLTITPAEVNEWIAGTNLAASSVRLYVQVLAMVLDELDVDNAARHRSVRLPRVEVDEIEPPDSATILASLPKMTKRWRLAVVTLEQTGMRVGELTGLQWSDVDTRQSRFRLTRQRTKTARPRWVPVPRWLMNLIEDTCPREDRAGRVFPKVERTPLATAIRRACRDAGVAHYSPHDLRHRRISILHGKGIPTRQISELVGHARPSMTVDRYSHVMALDEMQPERLEAVLTT